MKLGGTALFQYRLPLAKPLPGKLNRLASREGLLVRLTSHQNKVGWGEIAPLAGFSVETLEMSRDSAIRYLSDLRKLDISEPEDVLKSGIGARSQVELPSSVKFGMESAILNLWAASSGTALRQLINPQSADTIPVNGLLSGEEKELLDDAGRMVGNGYKTLKLKVGSESIEDDISKVRALRKLVPRAAIRLDANRAWDLESAIRFGEAVRDLNIEFIEEPLADTTRLEDFYRLTGLAYALDESLLAKSPDNLERLDGLHAVILKPTLLGGLSIALGFAARAKELGLRPVISSAFESSIGLATLANLASAVAPNVACGLDTATWFADDLFDHKLTTSTGTIDLANYDMAVSSVRTNLLSEIAVPQ